MSDYTHYILSAFRESMLNAVAKLEFEVRDSIKNRPEPIKQNKWFNDDVSEISDIHDNTIDELTKKLDLVIQRLDAIENAHCSCTTSVCKEDVHELLKFQPLKNTKNILIPSVKSTPALTAAVAAASANLPIFSLDSNQTDESFSIVNDVHVSHEDTKKNTEDDEDEEEVVVEDISEESEELEEEVVVEDTLEDTSEELEEEVIEDTAEEESPNLEPIQIKGKLYYKDDENIVYAETDDGYEQIGIYNPKNKDIEEAEEEEEEDDEEAVEVEEFIFKGKTYQKDSDNNVYLDGDQIGIWNGKKIIPT